MSNGTIARRCSISPSTVTKYLAALA
ncbi:winged helix-turn-helix transcriptional regulator [Hymenobacter sp. B1770]